MAERDPGIPLACFADLSEMPSQDAPVLPRKNFDVCFSLFLSRHISLRYFISQKTETQNALGGKGPERSSCSHSSTVGSPLPYIGMGKFAGGDKLTAEMLLQLLRGVQ